MSKSKLRLKWEAASADLGVDIVAPYQVELGGGLKLRAEILVRNFGGPKGTLVFTTTDLFWDHRDAVCDLGYGVSVLDEPRGDPVYDRNVFIEMLSEWGWAGSGASKPDWLLETD